ncbi:hypothetical protein GUITHDRAFT_105696 [Guillardia theta CCMP2712]|uniref:Uncharacterized protein n=1 Tax=Guillardia theta (strain CCMP2712) TaxID=905079 RepID=L1JJ51_GUITC|nr:hypothetical protein GUITHDRAFT_105696 [Guillardia theta CCMP2712]EKX48553.1 hypothetical protein GUITHDRAFT_105696 [Guillardia theta CCMP2712]|eukprot:XP_005835533.1 hypothetical protein GUITHDRAFT_105696 [Guillardia theta CCMP2712]
MHRWQRVREDAYKELVMQQSKHVTQSSWTKVLDELQSWVVREGQAILELYDAVVNRVVIPLDFLLLADEFPYLSEYFLKDYAGFQKSLLAACKIFITACTDVGKVDVECLRCDIRLFYHFAVATDFRITFFAGYGSDLLAFLVSLGSI